jgi:3-hydroxyisobutyrate dehydrogenase
MTETADNKPAVALLGCGIMGAGMARSLLREGVALRLWNRTRSKAEPLADDGAEVAATPEEAVASADVVLTMLADGRAVQETISAAAPGLHEGQVWVQTSTVGAAATSDLAEQAKQHGVAFVDAPVLGTKQPAEQGKLLVLAAGPDDVRDRIQPVLDAIGQRTMWLDSDGAAAKASRLKLVLNSWVLAATTGVAEAVSLAEGLDLDPKLFIEAVSGGALDMPYLQVKSGAILTGDYAPSFPLTMAGKDADLVVEAARSAGLRLPMAGAVAERFHRAAGLGHGGEDMAATYFASFDVDDPLSPVR